MSFSVLFLPSMCLDDIKFGFNIHWQSRDLHLSRNTLYRLSPRLCFFVILNHDLVVISNDSLTSENVIM